jgi:hypothetical protein
VGDIVAEGGGVGVAAADDRCWAAVESVVVVLDPEAIANFGLPMFVVFRCFVLVQPRNRV